MPVEGTATWLIMTLYAYIKSIVSFGMIVVVKEYVY